MLTAWLFRALAMAWLLVAGVVGGIVRRFGRNARDLPADHKRDGLGLVFFGLAIVFAAAVWARMHNLAFEGVYTLTSSVMGEGAFTVPVIFALVGVRFMRHPDRNEALPPAEIGWTALMVGRARPAAHREGRADAFPPGRRLAGGQDRGRPGRHGRLLAAG